MFMSIIHAYYGSPHDISPTKLNILDNFLDLGSPKVMGSFHVTKFIYIDVSSNPM